jgi:YfiR/HmsC-like
MTLRSRCCRVLAICCVVLGVAHDLRGADELVGEQQVKAAFLFNVVKFVQWPPSNIPADSVVIGLVSRDSFRRTLEGVVNGKTVNGRSIVVRELHDEGEARGCQIVYFDEATDGPRRDGILRSVREGAVLTVGETGKFLAEGGLIRLYVEGDRLRFQIDPVGVQLSGLKVSAQLMSLAK